jgi:amino acid permease
MPVVWVKKESKLFYKTIRIVVALAFCFFVLLTQFYHWFKEKGNLEKSSSCRAKLLTKNKRIVLIKSFFIEPPIKHNSSSWWH